MTKGEFHKALSLYSEAITKEQKKDKNSKILYSLLCERASILLKVSLFDESMLDIKKAINIDETNTKV
jgi:tetratricopeptide (TPR) repeat protein